MSKSERINIQKRVLCKDVSKWLCFKNKETNFFSLFGKEFGIHAVLDVEFIYAGNLTICLIHVFQNNNNKKTFKGMAKLFPGDGLEMLKDEYSKSDGEQISFDKALDKLRNYFERENKKLSKLYLKVQKDILVNLNISISNLIDKHRKQELI